MICLDLINVKCIKILLYSVLSLGCAIIPAAKCLYAHMHIYYTYAHILHISTYITHMHTHTRIYTYVYTV